MREGPGRPRLPLTPSPWRQPVHRDRTEGEWPPGLPEAKRGEFDLPTIHRWLEVFVRRFFASQFKRSALPNGPKVSPGGTMSPRGDWRMPSDASAAAWLRELERDVPH